MGYLKYLVRSKAAEHPNWDIEDFFVNYAPKNDGNDPVGYAKFVAKGLRMPVDTPLKSLFA